MILLCNPPLFRDGIVGIKFTKSRRMLRCGSVMLRLQGNSTTGQQLGVNVGTTAATPDAKLTGPGSACEVGKGSHTCGLVAAVVVCVCVCVCA